MAMQQTTSAFPAKFAQQIAASQAAHRDKPMDVGMMRLPPDIRDGVAKLQLLQLRTQAKEDGRIPKGEQYLYGQAVVLKPVEHGGIRTQGLQTFLRIPLCEIPAKGDSKGKTFDENWYDYQNIFKLLSNGAIVCRETDPQKIWQFYVAAAAALTERAKDTANPVLVLFSTSGWKGKKKLGESDAEYAAREPMVFEKWHGLADPKLLNGAAPNDPAGGVTMRAPAPQPPAHEPPPVVNNEPPVPTNSRIHEQEASEGDDTDEVARLVDLVTNDYDSDEGQAAAKQLEEMAWANGWTREDTEGAEGWDIVGQMATSRKDGASEEIQLVSPGMKCKYRKRDKDGLPLVDKKKQPLPALDVEVVAVDAATKTCTLRTTSDGKDVMDMKTRKPAVVKFEWLE